MKLETKYHSLMNIIEKHKVGDATALSACFSLLSAGNKIDKACATRLAVHQLSESRFLLLTLLFEYGALSPLALAQLSGVTKPTITSLTTALEKEGLIIRSDVAEDGRKFEISLTEAGRTLIGVVFQDHSRWITRITQNLSQQEMNLLVGLLDKMFVNNPDNE